MEACELELNELFKSGKLKKEENNWKFYDLSMHLFLVIFNTYHLILQPKFHDIVIDRKPIRPDLFLFIPLRDNEDIAVGCDSWLHHNGKESYERGRKIHRTIMKGGGGSSRHAAPGLSCGALFKYKP